MNLTPGAWHEHQLAGHLVDLYVPENCNQHGHVLVYLHGVHLQRLVANPFFKAEFDRHGLPVVAPMTKRSWWTDRRCPEFDDTLTAERYLLDKVLPFIHNEMTDKTSRVALLGTSMGGQGALRLAFKHPNAFPIVAALAPAIDFQWRYDEEDKGIAAMYADEEAARQDSATLHVHPLNWPRNIWFSCDPGDVPWIESAQKLQMKLVALGIPHECDLETEAGGHGFDYYNRLAPRAMEFVATRLEQERLRIV